MCDKEFEKKMSEDFVGNQKLFWNRVKGRKKVKEEWKINEKDGTLVEDEEGVLERWKEWFDELLNEKKDEKEMKNVNSVSVSVKMKKRMRL